MLQVSSGYCRKRLSDGRRIFAIYEGWSFRWHISRIISDSYEMGELWISGQSCRLTGKESGDVKEFRREIEEVRENCEILWFRSDSFCYRKFFPSTRCEKFDMWDWQNDVQKSGNFILGKKSPPCKGYLHTMI